MKPFIKTAVLGILLAGFSALAFADILYTKSGQSLEGRVVAETEAHVTFEFQGGQMEFSRAEIDRIEKKEFTLMPVFAKKNTAEGEGFSFEKWWQDVLAWFSPEEQAKKTKSRQENNAWSEAGIIALVSFVQILVASASMKTYFAVSGTHYKYWEMLWFQIKLLLIGSLVGLLTAFCVGFIAGLTAGSTGTTIRSDMGLWLLGSGSFLIGYTLTYYGLAKRTLDAGFVEAFILGMVIGLTYFVVTKVMAHFGFSYTDPLADYLQTFAQTVGLR